MTCLTIARPHLSNLPQTRTAARFLGLRGDPDWITVCERFQRSCLSNLANSSDGVLPRPAWACLTKKTPADGNRPGSDHTMLEHRMTNETIDLRLPIGQYPSAEPVAGFREQSLSKAPFYQGSLADSSPAEVEALMAETMRYFGLSSYGTVPPPPTGLPGTSGSVSSLTMRSIAAGITYLYAIVNRKPRQQWDRALSMEDLLNERWRGGYNQARAEYEAALLDRLRAEHVERDEQLPPTEAGLVYFIGSDLGQVKIGKAINPERRMATLQTSHPARLRLLATCEGGLIQEAKYHKRFARHRLAGEWFARVPEIEAEIARLHPPTTD